MDDARRQRVKLKSLFWLIVLIITAILLSRIYSIFWPSDHNRPKLSVVAAVAHTADVPISLNALGSVTPIDSVIVKSQISGYLHKVLFIEGQIVKKGDVLAEVDPRLNKAQMIQYQGQLARDLALLSNAQLDLKRYQKLWQQDSISKQALDTQASLVKQLEGTIQLDRGLLLTTQVNLEYTKILAPIDGRIGLSLVNPGNYVQPSDATGLAIINTVDPITVLFSIPEDNVPEVMEQISKNQILKTNIFDRQQKYLLGVGKLKSLDNQIDSSTGTLKLRAEISNPESKLIPNQFVNVQLIVSTLKNAIVVPTAAIQYRTQGAFVYEIRQDSTVSIKPVKTGPTYGDETAVITGISPGELVVVEGADKLVEGSKVTAQLADIPKTTVATEVENVPAIKSTAHTKKRYVCSTRPVKKIRIYKICSIKMGALNHESV